MEYLLILTSDASGGQEEHKEKFYGQRPGISWLILI